jgi:predicted acylesterase/phospholipase RssA
MAIVLSGTAPAMTLMSGVMLAFAERGVKFEVISTTGVGALIGMLYLAPRTGSPEKALRELPNLFVSDWLYRLFPVNFKVFHKNGPYAERFFALRKHLPQISLDPKDPSRLKRFVNDSVQLWATALTPRSFESTGKGWMSHVPLIEDLVDFKKLKESNTRFYVNAFSLYQRKLRIFGNDATRDGNYGVDSHGIDANVYNGAQAMFALFEPARIAGDKLTTGATHDPTALQAIWVHERRRALARGGGLDGVLALDPVSRSVWRKPENVYDAFQLMLMNPIAAAHEPMLALYAKIASSVETLTAVERTQMGGALPPLFFLPFKVDESYYPTMLKWTHDNALKLHDIGYTTAKPLAEIVQQGNLAALEADYDFETRFLRNPRTLQFLNLFNPTFERYSHFAQRVARIMETPARGV